MKPGLFVVGRSEGGTANIWRGVSFGLAGYLLGLVVGAGLGSATSSAGAGSGLSTTLPGLTASVGGLFGAGLGSLRYRNRRMTRADLKLLRFAAAIVVAVATVVYLLAGLPSAISGLVTGTGSVLVLRIALVERSSSHFVTIEDPHRGFEGTIRQSSVGSAAQESQLAG